MAIVQTQRPDHGVPVGVGLKVWMKHMKMYMATRELPDPTSQFLPSGRELGVACRSQKMVSRKNKVWGWAPNTLFQAPDPQCSTRADCPSPSLAVCLRLFIVWAPISLRAVLASKPGFRHPEAYKT